MFRFIRRLTDAEKLSKELEDARAEISSLKSELLSKTSAPSFMEVARNFDASVIYPKVAERVVEDLSPFLEREAVKLLKEAFSDLEKNRRGRPMMIAYIAEDYTEQVFQIEFETDRMGTSVRIPNFL